jgi:hypothetical protein
MAMDRHDSSLARTVMVVGVVSLSDMGVVVVRDFVALRQ